MTPGLKISAARGLSLGQHFQAQGHSFFTIRTEPKAWVALERILLVLPKIGSKLWLFLMQPLLANIEKIR